MSGRSISGEYLQNCQNTSVPPQEQPTTNRFIYLRQQIAEKSSHGPQKVLLNPHFKQNKVFVNPMFSGIQPIQSNTIHVNPRLNNLNAPILVDKRYINNQPFRQDVPLQSTKIHVNPQANSVQISLITKLIISQPMSQTVHINPNFKNQSVPSNVLLNQTHMPHSEKKMISPSVPINRAVVLTRTKLIRTSAVKDKNKKVIGRNSNNSKYKIVKSTLYSVPESSSPIDDNEEIKSKSRYKIDHRRRKSLCIRGKNRRKYVYINRFISVSDLTKTCVIKGPPISPVKSVTVVNICGQVYRKSRTSLIRTSGTNLSINKSPRTAQVSKYKLVKRPVLKKATKSSLETKLKVSDNSVILKKFKIVRKSTPKRTKAAKVAPRILRKCNIPCPYYRKYGLCKGKENGKCYRKHDPDQIALCTRFLQGACIKEKCLLSHNVSPEKMPTCKYYLEGSCSKENCPYLHIRINPKAEVCRDFLEGFCKKAAECNQRHQYLCPDYEKYGNCLKQRCPYPHGKLVRNYLWNKTKFAKKCHNNEFIKKDQRLVLTGISFSKPIETNFDKNEQVLIEKQRYYEENNLEIEEVADKPCRSVKDTLEKPENSDETNKTITKHCIGLQSRPKLGTLPAFIPFGK